jgi:hypothetical protein
MNKRDVRRELAMVFSQTIFDSNLNDQTFLKLQLNMMQSVNLVSSITVQCDLIVFSQVTFSISSRPVHPLGALQPQTRLALEVFGKSCRPLKMSLLAATTSMALQYLSARGEGTSEQTAERIECFETILNTDGNVVHPASYQFQIVGVCHW